MLMRATSPFAYETAGAARTRHSLRPLVSGGQADGKNSGAFVSREYTLTSHRRHSGARSEAARARNPSHRDHCGPMDSGFARSLSSGRALRGPGGAPPNDEGGAAHPGMTTEGTCTNPRIPEWPSRGLRRWPDSGDLLCRQLHCYRHPSEGRRGTATVPDPRSNLTCA